MEGYAPPRELFACLAVVVDSFMVTLLLPLWPLFKTILMDSVLDKLTPRLP